MARGIYMVAAFMAALWLSAVTVVFVLFDSWFFSQPSTLLLAFALLFCPIWGIVSLAKIIDTQNANELSLKEMQKLIISMERQLYDQTQSHFMRQDDALKRKEKSEADLVVKVASQPVQEVAILEDKKNLKADLPDTLDVSQADEDEKIISVKPPEKKQIPAAEETAAKQRKPSLQSNRIQKTENMSEEEKREFSWISFISAADFPQDDDDPQGFACVQDTLQDAFGVKFLNSAEDTLALLAEKDLFMEDYEPEVPGLEDWKKLPLTLTFDKNCLTAARKISVAMRDNQETSEVFTKFSFVFEEAAERILKETNGREILGLADTRAGRAYLLITRGKQILEKSDTPLRTSA
jgi:hypothetical protein